VSPSIRHFFVKRGWVECSSDSNDWNVFWRDRAFPRVIHQKLKAHQRLNHHLVPSVISRKDRLAQTMLRMYQTHGPIYDIVPQTFLLPQHWDEFAHFFSQVQAGLPSSSDSPSAASSSSSSSSSVSSSSTSSSSSSIHQCSRNLWIYKPATGRRGQGIFLLEHPSQVTEKLQGQPDAAGVVQRYIASPYLIGGFKFDLRVYVLVPTFCPFTAYVHTKGLARFRSAMVLVGVMIGLPLDCAFLFVLVRSSTICRASTTTTAISPTPASTRRVRRWHPTRTLWDRVPNGRSSVCSSTCPPRPETSTRRRCGRASRRWCC